MREVPSAGRTGSRREYAPPPEILALIEARQRGEEPVALPRKGRKRSTDTVGIAEAEERAAALATRVEASMRVAEAAVRITLAAERTQWLRRLNEETRARVALGAYRLIAIMSEGDDQQLQRWTESPESLQGMLRMAYEADCIKRGIRPGSDMLSAPEEGSITVLTPSEK